MSILSSSCRQISLNRLTLRKSLHSVYKRNLNIHEYQAMELLKSYHIKTPQFQVASTPAEAEVAAEHIGGQDLVIKAQVLAGGRGKGTFSSGFVGGVQPANSALEARSLAAKMLNQRLVTKQTDALGKPVSKVLVTKRLYCRREAYFAITLDRKAQAPVIVASRFGGVDIEKVAEEKPDAICKEIVDLEKGPNDVQIERIARSMGFASAHTVKQASQNIKHLYKLFRERDASLVEINPMVETHDHEVLCVDAKLNFDDNALFRQKELIKLRDPSQEDPREVLAERAGLNYIQLDGNIGCLVNGAGLAMATMDIIKLNNGSPANFLDIGGGASQEQVAAAFSLLADDEHVKAILVNIFGGIMRCDVIALGLIAAIQQTGLKKPVVIRLAGTNQTEAQKLIEDSGLRMLTANDLDTAAKKVVRVAEILRMAGEARLDVKFEIPI